MAKRVFLIVLDSFGMGELPDAGRFGDEGSNTLAAVAASPAFLAPRLTELGLFNIEGAVGGERAENPAGAFARLAEQSPGKDTTVGHWEMAGVIAKEPLPTFPNGFPELLLARLSGLVYKDFLCNKPYSGTDVLRDFGREHIRTGKLIVYTSADSVMQVAAHESIVPLADLYGVCEAARKIMQPPDLGVGRVIARPFTGDPGEFTRTANRRDYSLPPPGPTMLDHLSKRWLETIAVGKIYDIFAGQGITRAVKSKSNREGMRHAVELAKKNFSGLCFVNLVDFDMLYGHRNDADGYARAITEFDSDLGELLSLLRPEDLLILTADHGCDPSTPSTDHSREYVPMLICGAPIRQGADLGTRNSFADIAATIQDYFGLPVLTQGESFLQEVIL